jgi:uncharacterized protein YtpQ (UPF0354 family)
MFSLFRKKQPPPKPQPLIVPRIKQTNFARAIDDIPGMNANSRPIIEPLVGDLLLTYAIDIGPSYMAVTPNVLRENNLQQSDLRVLGEANALHAMRSLKVRTDGTVHEITADENMVACTILFPELWQQIEQEIGAPIVAAFPHRDFVIYSSQDKIDALKQIVNGVDFNETHALSKLIFQRFNGGWRVVTD